MDDYQNTIITNGGIQAVLAEAYDAPKQVVYLDFDGAQTSYHNQDLDLTIDDVCVEASGIDEEDIRYIVNTLNDQFGDTIVFTVDIPQVEEYSTVYIGKTDAFDIYGDFLGLAETIDVGNQIHNDNAFVILDSTASITQVVSTIAHETQHIAEGMQHEGEGLQAYAVVIESGVTSTGIIVEEGDTLRVRNGGIAEYTTVESEGYVYVSSGGFAEYTTVDSEGYVYVSSGGFIDYTNIKPFGYVCVSSGGTAEHTTINSYGSVYVAPGGSLEHTNVNSYGSVFVASSGFIEHTIINSAGSVCINSGGFADSTIIYSGGFLDVARGGSALHVENSGRICCVVGENDTKTIVQGVNADGASFFISNGIASNVSGLLTVDDGGIAISTTVTQPYDPFNYGWGDNVSMRILSGGMAEYTTIMRNGAMKVLHGGTANSTVVNSGGHLVVDSGGTAVNVLNSGAVDGCVKGNDKETVVKGVNADGTNFFISNGVASNVSGVTEIYEGGIAVSTTVTPYRYGEDERVSAMMVYEGGVAEYTTIMRSGTMDVLSGGTANSTVVKSGGHLQVDSGGTAFNVENLGIVIGSVVGGDTETVLEGVNADGTTFFISNGIASNVFGNLTVAEAGMAISTTVIPYNDEALVAAINCMSICSGGIAEYTTVTHSGRMVVSSGGIANSTIVNTGGYLAVESGGTAFNVLNSGVVYCDVMGGDTETIVKGVNADGTNFYISNGVASNVVGALYVYDGGFADNTRASGATCAVDFGGRVTNTVIDSKGYLYVGGTAVDTLVAGSMILNEEGIAECTTVKPQGVLDVYVGGSAFNVLNSGSVLGSVILGDTQTIVKGSNADGTEFYISNGVASNVVGGLDVYSGGIADSTTVTSGHQMMVLSGGTALNVLNSGNVTGYVISGDTQTVVKGKNADGTEFYISNGVASNVLGGLDISDGGIAYATMVNAGKCLYVSSGGTALGVKENGGVVAIDSGATITYASNCFSGMVVNNSTLLMVSLEKGISEVTVHSGTTAVDTTIENNNGFGMCVYDGGIACNTTVTRGRLIIESGGSHTGKLHIDDRYVDSNYRGANVSFEEGAIVDFSVYECKAEATALITNWNWIEGRMLATYTITVAEDQAQGMYALAENATDFNGSITVKNTEGTVFGDIDINGKTLAIDGNTLALSIEDNNLCLSVADITPPVIILEGDNLTLLQKSSIKATTEENIDIYYSTDNESWTKYTGILEVIENGTWYFKATDAAGNVGTNSIEFKNIDRVAPVIELSGDTTTSLQQSSITATTEAGLDIYYSKDNQNWEKYFNELEVIENGTWYFKATDAAGNIGTNSIEFKNIDRVAPIIELKGDTTTPLQQSSITASTEPGLDIYYSTDNQNWEKYTDALEVTENGTWYFKATDAAGNVGTNSIEFKNIDRVAPVIELSGDTTTSLQLSSIIATTEDGVDIYYSTDNTNWTKYTEALDVIENGIWYFKAEDAAGNIGTNFIEFKNIDRVAPVIELTGDTTSPLQQSSIMATTEDGVDIYYSTDNESWEQYSGKLDVTANGIWYFKATDAAGNVGTNSIEFNNIDTEAPVIELEGDTTTICRQSSITATTEDGVDIYYSTDNENWAKYTGTLEVTENGTWYFKATDAAGNEGTSSIEFSNIDRAPMLSNVLISAPSEDAKVVISFDCDSDVVQRFYSFNEGEWTAFEDNELTFGENGTVRIKLVDEAGNESVSDGYEVNVSDIPLDGLETAAIAGTTDALQLSWNKGGLDGWTQTYQVNVSINDQKLDVPQITGEGLELHGLGKVNIAWSVTPEWSKSATNGTDIVFEGTQGAEPQVVQALDNGIAEALLARKFDTWGDGYFAQHVGNTDNGSGTREILALNGKNRIADVFAGSDDTTLLYLTDDANGDALFVDDVFSQLPGSLKAQQARIAQIDVIYAGAGDDLVDMTSQRFEYDGDGMIIRGGTGNDTIWANKGSNTLFGDAGNDRLVGASGDDVIVGGAGNDSMHGGGGQDIFCFCSGWGQDTVEQLAEGKVTLWFADGVEGTWNETTLTYTVGANTVKVSGVSKDQVTLKFGDDDSDLYDTLLADGAFAEFSSENIFEKQSKGQLAG